MGRKKMLLGDTLVSKLTGILFADGITPVTQECFEWLLKGVDQKTLELLAERCMAISAKKHDDGLITNHERSHAISSIIMATFIACQESKLKIFWLNKIAEPLIKTSKREQKWPGCYGKSELEDFSMAVVISMLQCFNLVDKIPEILGNTAAEQEEFEQLFTDFLAQIIYKPSEVMWVNMPDDKQRSVLGYELKKFGARLYKVSKQSIALSLLNKVRGNLPDEAPWSAEGALHNYHFSEMLLEKIMYSHVGNLSLMEKLELMLVS
ncbi:hypothetical protein ACFL2U_01500 [Patescibacteria group bacterium]